MSDVLDWPVRTAEYMLFDVTANVDPLLDNVKVALVEHRTTPTDSDYHAAQWEPGQTWAGPSTQLHVQYFVDRNTLAADHRYDAWVQIDDDPETLEIFAGVVRAR